MQNMIEEQEALKDFSDQQLLKELQMPSGGIRPISVVSELNRRKRMRADQARAEAASAPTVAEEVVMAAGMGDMSQMARAMAPKTSIAENTGIAAMMPRQPTRMATGGVVKMQTAGEVLKQQRNPETRKETLGSNIIGNLSPAVIELSLNGAYGENAQRKVIQAAIAGELGLGMQREVLSKALAGEYGAEIKESAERARGVLEQSGLRGFKPEGSQLAPTAATAETVVSPSRGFEPTSSQLASAAATAENVVSPSRGFEPTASQLAPMASMAETVKPEFKSGILKSGIRGFEPTSSQLAPTAANAETVFPPSMMMMPAMRDPAVIDPMTGQPYDALGSMRQQAEQTRQAEAQAAFEQSRLTPDELMVPFNNSPDPADLTRFLASQKPRFQGGNVPGGSLPSENQRLIEEAAEMKERLDKQRAESNFMNPDRFNRTPEDKLKSPEEQFAELGATKQVIDGEEFFVTPIGNTYDSRGRPVQGGKAMQALQSAQKAGEDFTVGGAIPTSKLPFIGTDTVGPSLNFLPDITNIPFGSYDVDAQGNVIPESYKKAELDISNITTPDIIKKPTSNLASLLGVDEGKAPVTDVTSVMNPQYENRFGVDRTVGTTIAGDPRIASGVVGETVKEDKKETPNVLENVNFAKSDTTFLDNQPQTREDMIESETAAVINSAANTLANDVGEEALGAKGPEAAKAAQQGFDKRMWMRIAMFGLIASEGTAKSRSEAAKTFLAMDAKDKALETRERIAIGDRESREKVAGIRSKATQANTEARIKSATLNRDFRVLESIQDELKESLALITPVKGPVAAENKDAYDTLTQQLKEVREQIRNLGSFDLGPGSGQTEIAGSYNVTAGAS